MHADAHHDNPALAERLARIYGLHRKDMDFRLGAGPYVDLLQKLGNPHLHLPPCVHVAGTNGKGSVVAFSDAMLRAGGYRVHAYTSPHLLRFNERIRLNNADIDDATLIALFDEVWAANDGAPVTFFEFTTALAFLGMARVPADVCLIEVGLGGRLDCTNVITPAVSIITRISYDHTEILGHDLATIAAEKAGIIKPNVPCVVGPQADADIVWPVFERIASAAPAPLTLLEAHGTSVIPPQAETHNRHARAGGHPATKQTVSLQHDHIGAIAPLAPDPRLHGGDNKNTTSSSPLLLPVQNVLEGLPAPALAGEHQYGNAAAAIVALSHLPLTLTRDHIARGLISARWPARLEHITDGPVRAALPPATELWFDAAHNDSGADALGAWLRTQRASGKTVHLMVGMGADKDTARFFAALTDAFDALTILDLPYARMPQTAQALVAKLPTSPPSVIPAQAGIQGDPVMDTGVRRYDEGGMVIITAPSARAAADAVRADLCVVAGSLYLYQTVR